jgi:hypothetical protein
MLGVTRCIEQLEEEGAPIDSRGNAHAREQLRNRHRPRASHNYSVSKSTDNPMDIMAPPAKRVNICTKLVEFVFNL